MNEKIKPRWIVGRDVAQRENGRWYITNGVDRIDCNGLDESNKTLSLLNDQAAEIEKLQEVIGAKDKLLLDILDK